MKTKSVVISSVFVAITAASTFASAEDINADHSRDVFVDGTIRGNWKPAASSVSNDTPSVDKSLAVFGGMVLGKTPRVTPESDGKLAKNESASQLFTRQFQTNYRLTKS